MSTDATRCKVCGGQFSAKRIIIDGCAYHERCAVMSYPSHTHEDYSRLSDWFSIALAALEEIACTSDEDNEWDGVDKFHKMRDVAGAALAVLSPPLAAGETSGQVTDFSGGASDSRVM